MSRPIFMHWKQGEAEADDSDNGMAVVVHSGEPVPLSNGDNKALIAET